jgi:hypothetical protein
MWPETRRTCFRIQRTLDHLARRRERIGSWALRHSKRGSNCLPLVTGSDDDELSSAVKLIIASMFASQLFLIGVSFLNK